MTYGRRQTVSNGSLYLPLVPPLAKLGKITANTVIFNPLGYRNPRVTGSKMIRNGAQEWVRATFRHLSTMMGVRH